LTVTAADGESRAASTVKIPPRVTVTGASTVTVTTATTVA